MPRNSCDEIVETGEAQFYPLSSDWPILAIMPWNFPFCSVSFCRARADGRQCRTAEARFKRSAVRAED